MHYKLKTDSILILLISVMCLSNLLNAQSEISFRQLSVKEGLSQNSVISIAQDSTGYLWMATQDGLNKYDGQSFKKYEFLFEDITNVNYSDLGKVYRDKKDKLWIIPSSKIPHKYNPKTDEFEAQPDLKDISVVFQDSQLNHWFGSFENGLFKKDFSNGVVSQVLKPSITDKIYAISEDNSGHLWLGCKGHLISYKLNDGQVNTFKPVSDKTAHFGSLLVDSNKIYAGTFGLGVWTKDQGDDSFKTLDVSSFEVSKDFEQLYILSLLKDSKDCLWIGTYGDGLFKINYKQNVLTNYTIEKNNPKSIHYNDILSIHEDQTGVLWFGTDGAGVSYYDEYLDKFNYYTHDLTPNNINIDVVRSIVTNDEGEVWIGTSGKGLTRFNPKDKSWKTYFKTDKNVGLSCDRIMSLYVDDEQELWIGTQDGGLHIMKKPEKIIQHRNHPNVKVEVNTIWRIHEDDYSNKWLATGQRGLLLFDKNKGIIKEFSKTNSNFPSNNIRVVIDAEPNYLWVATDERQILKLNTKTGEYEDFTKYLFQEDNPIKKNFIIKSLLYENNSILWIGTAGNGLLALDIKTQKTYQYDKDKGLANNVIYAIMPDKKGHFWLSSNKGITRFTVPDTWDKQPEITNYTNYDGLSIEFNTGAYHKAKNGNIYFGALDGFYWLNPLEIENNKEPPKTVISNFEVNDKEMSLSENLALESSQNTMTFTFSSLQFSLPHKNLFSYKLEGYDEEWSKASNINFARYTNLPSGDYTFKVISSNYDNVWNKQPTELSFQILKPWYASNKAIVLYILFIFLITYLIYNYLRVRWQMKMELSLEHEKSERLKQISDFKTKLFTNLSHEFRTPLTLISAPIKKQLQNKNLKPALKQELAMVDNNATRLSDLVNQLLEFSKLESGFIKLKISHGNLKLFLESIVSSFMPLAVQKKIKLKTNIYVNQFAWYDERVVEQILNNLLSNAVKYTPKNGKIILNITSDNDLLSISIKNDISSIEELNIDRIFERFYQTDSKNEGFGIGLSLIKELSTLNKGTVNAEYVNDNAIHFWVELPIEKEQFEKHEIHEPTEHELRKELLKEDLSKVNNIETNIILIVEDHRDMLLFLTRLFEDHYKVIQAENGKEGIKKAVKHIPDIIISDVMMPEVDGITLCKTLKTDEKTSHIPIILLTAKSGEDNELIGLKTGADDYILKPFNPEKIKIRVKKLVEVRHNLQKRYQQNAVLKPKDIAVTEPDKQFLDKLQTILDDNLTESNFNPQKFCRELGMSRMQLHRKLVALTGLSTSAFIKSQRLKYACALLQKSELYVSEIAYACGFNSPSYFTKSFKETFGKTPQDYTNSL